MHETQTRVVDEVTNSDGPTFAKLMTMAERELGAFISAVTELFGFEQVRLAAEDWLDELVLMKTLPGLTSRDWRSITIAASARLANRVNASSHPLTSEEVSSEGSWSLKRLQNSTKKEPEICLIDSPYSPQCCVLPSCRARQT